MTKIAPIKARGTSLADLNKRRATPSGAILAATQRANAQRRYTVKRHRGRSFMYVQYTALSLLCCTKKWALAVIIKLVLIGPRTLTVKN